MQVKHNPKEFEAAEGEVKLFVRQWFWENQDFLEDAVANFLPLSSASREDLTYELIKNFAQKDE